jgi:hypothetical protein
MGGTVELSVQFDGTGHELARRVAEALGLWRAYSAGHTHVLPVDAVPWIGVEGWAHLVVSDRRLEHDAETFAGTAYEPFEFEVSVDFRGPRERLGRALFERLTVLGLPMAYGDDVHVLADHLPGRGPRDFPPGTPVEAEGRASWHEPALPPPSAAPTWRLGSGAVTAYESGGLVQLVPRFGARLLRPIASARVGVGAEGLGLLLSAALGTADRPGVDERDAVLGHVDAALGPAGGVLGRAVTFDVAVVGDEVVATAGGLTRRAGLAGGPEPLGELVLGMVGDLRQRRVEERMKAGVDWDRVVAVWDGAEERRDWPGAATFAADGYLFTARPADWLVARAPWVEAAVRVVGDAGFDDGDVVVHGVLLTPDGTLLLNDVATMRELGRRLGGDLDPLAYAELLAELYSGPRLDEDRVVPFAPSEAHRAGELVRDPGQLRWVDHALLSPPAVRTRPDGIELTFCSLRAWFLTLTPVVDVLHWTVTGGRDRPASWSRRTLAEGRAVRRS